MKKIIYLVLLLGFTLVSCADLQREQHLRQLAKQHSKLQDLSAQLDRNTITEVAQIKNNTIQTELRIKQHLHLDTINLELAQKLEAYKLMRKSIKPLMQQFVKIRKGIKEEKHTLLNLKQDIKAGRGNRQHYGDYIRFERQKIKQLQALTNDYLIARKTFYKDYKRLYPSIEAFSLELLNKDQQ